MDQVERQSPRPERLSQLSPKLVLSRLRDSLGMFSKRQRFRCETSLTSTHPHRGSRAPSKCVPVPQTHHELIDSRKDKYHCQPVRQDSPHVKHLEVKRYLVPDT